MRRLLCKLGLHTGWKFYQNKDYLHNWKPDYQADIPVLKCVCHICGKEEAYDAYGNRIPSYIMKDPWWLMAHNIKWLPEDPKTE
jgi:hypothetical protein